MHVHTDYTRRPTTVAAPRARVVQLTTAPIFLTWFLEGHTRALRSAGYDVHVISSPGPELERFAQLTGATAHAVEMARNIRFGSDVSALSRFTEVLDEIEPDIVHAHTPKAGLLGMMSAAYLRVPVRVYHCHGLRYETTRGAFRAMLWGAERTACTLATHVLTVSPSLRKALVEARLVPAAKAHVLHGGSIGGVDAGRFRPSSTARSLVRGMIGIPLHARVVGFVGRVVRDKGVVDLYAAWRRLRERLPDTHLLVVGPIERGDPVPAEVMEGMRADPRVHLHGAVTDTASFYPAMDVLALPSHREGFGVVNIEAAATSLPVVATRIRGCVDAVVDGVTGTLVPPNDAVRLEGALRKYLEDPKLRTLHGEAGRARVLEHFRPEAFWSALQAHYDRWLYDAGLRRGSAAAEPLRAANA